MGYRVGRRRIAGSLTLRAARGRARAPRTFPLPPGASTRERRGRNDACWALAAIPMIFEPRYRTLVDIFEHAVRAYGHRPLFGMKVGDGWSWTTYGEFGRQVDRCRGALATLGVGRGDRVALISDNRVEWAVVAYACLGSGAAVVPMYEAQDPAEQDFILRDCGAQVLVLTEKAAARRAGAAPGGPPSLRRTVLIGSRHPGAAGTAYSSYESLVSAALPAPLVRAEPEEVAFLIYTSGTTGKPKGVVLSHGNIASNVRAMHEVVPAEDGDRSLSFLPWAHVFGQTVELHAL